MDRRRITPVLDILAMLAVALGLFITLIFALRVQPVFVHKFNEQLRGHVPPFTRLMLQPWPMLAFTVSATVQSRLYFRSFQALSGTVP